MCASESLVLRNVEGNAQEGALGYLSARCDRRENRCVPVCCIGSIFLRLLLFRYWPRFPALYVGMGKALIYESRSRLKVVLVCKSVSFKRWISFALK